MFIKDNGTGGYDVAIKWPKDLEGNPIEGWIEVADDDERLALEGADDGSTMTYIQKRERSLADGGYGTWQEQLEMMEEDFDAWKEHRQAIKDAFPAP